MDVRSLSSTPSFPLEMRGVDAAQAASAWRGTLAGSPREILARLVQGDPLGVRGIVARRLRSECVLFDANLVHLRVIARIARAASRYRGRPSLEEWIDGLVSQTLGELIREEHESAPAHRGADASAPGVYASLATPLGLEPGAMRRACASFNVLPEADRSTFIDLVLHNRSLDDLAREQGQDATKIARRARRALDAILASAFPNERTATERGTGLA